MRVFLLWDRVDFPDHAMPEIAHSVHFASIGSTQTFLEESVRLDEGQRFSNLPLSECVVVSADQQTQGRGKGDRAWISAGRCVAMSIGIRVLNTEVKRAPVLTQIAAKAVITAIDRLRRSKDDALAPALSIKWPNDIVCRRRADGRGTRSAWRAEGLPRAALWLVAV